MLSTGLYTVWITADSFPQAVPVDNFIEFSTTCGQNVDKSKCPICPICDECDKCPFCPVCPDCAKCPVCPICTICRICPVCACTRAYARIGGITRYQGRTGRDRERDQGEGGGPGIGQKPSKVGQKPSRNRPEVSKNRPKSVQKTSRKRPENVQVLISLCSYGSLQCDVLS